MSWVGEWPPPSPGVHVVAHEARLEPTWDGTIRPLLGVGNGAGVVLSVRPDAADAVRAAVAGGLDDPDWATDWAISSVRAVPVSAEASSARVETSTRRSKELGEWSDIQRTEFPHWLAPFNGPRLVVRDDDGTVVAGVGIKAHDQYGHELSVVTNEAARGRIRPSTRRHCGASDPR